MGAAAIVCRYIMRHKYLELKHIYPAPAFLISYIDFTRSVPAEKLSVPDNEPYAVKLNILLKVSKSIFTVSDFFKINQLSRPHNL